MRGWGLGHGEVYVRARKKVGERGEKEFFFKKKRPKLFSFLNSH